MRVPTAHIATTMIHITNAGWHILLNGNCTRNVWFRQHGLMNCVSKSLLIFDLISCCMGDLCTCNIHTCMLTLIQFFYVFHFPLVLVASSLGRCHCSRVPVTSSLGRCHCSPVPVTSSLSRPLSRSEERSN